MRRVNEMANNTWFRVKYELDTEDAKTDVSDISATGYDPNYSNIDNVYYDNENTERFVTQEHNYTVLDGSYSLEEFGRSTPGKISFLSNIMSDSSGEFSPLFTPMIDIRFYHEHKSYAMTFYFIEDAPLEAEIEWWRNDIKIISKKATFDPNKRIQEVIEPISGFTRCKITFTKALPNRYIKLDFIEFGTTMHWDETIIKDGTLVKGLSRDGSQFSVDTLSFTIVDDSKKLNLANPRGIHTMFQRDQAITAYEDLDGLSLHLGKYFLDSFTTEGNIAKINAISYIGVLKRFNYNGSDILNGVAASTIIGDIFTAAGIPSSNYQIDQETASHLLYGTIRPCTCAEALQKVLFACHSTIDSTNPVKIQISKFATTVGSRIERKDKTRTKVSEIEAVDLVRLKYTTFVQGAEETEIFSDDYPSGSIQTVYFSDPYYNIRVASGADFISNTKYSITFQVYSNSTTVVVMGRPYTPVERTISKHANNKIKSNNIVDFSTELCSSATAKALLDKLAEYYGNSLRIEVQHYSNDDIMNTVTSIENQIPGLDNYVGIAEERSFNLTGGFLDSAKFRGYYDASDKEYYTSHDLPNKSTIELYAGDFNSDSYLPLL